jgi:hypothetical protein
MKKIAIYLLLFSTAACTEKIDFDLSDQVSYLVVDGLLTDEEKEHVVYLSKTTSFYDNNPTPPVSGALLTISDGETKWPLSERDPGVYYSPKLKGEVGKTYTLTIQYDGETYSASDYMGRIVDIDSAYITRDKVPFEIAGQNELYSIFMMAKEPEGTGDYYLWQYYSRKNAGEPWKLQTDSFQHWSYAPDNFVDGNAPALGYQVFSFIDSARMPSGVEVELNMYSISKEYYEFCNALSRQTFRGGPFDGPQANVTTNLSGTALGFFRVSARRTFITRNNY